MKRSDWAAIAVVMIFGATFLTYVVKISGRTIPSDSRMVNWKKI